MNVISSWIEQFRPAARGVASASALFARATLERLDAIREAVEDGNTSNTRNRTSHHSFTGPTVRELEVPIGESWGVSLVAASAACTVTVRSGGQLRFVKAYTAADTTSVDTVPIGGPGAPLTLTITGEAEVALVFFVTETTNPDRSTSGETKPAGLPSNSVGTEIERHFPGVLL